MTRTQKLLRLLSTALIAALVAGGDKACEYSCLGFGDCEAACPFGAIHVVEGRLAAVDAEKCVGCGACTQACPWHMPTVNPETKKSSKCIQCGACAEGCVTGALSIIPWDKIAAASQEI